jgi:hypothetical protein
VAVGLEHLGVQQSVAVLVGTVLAAGLSARFTDPGVPEES